MNNREIIAKLDGNRALIELKLGDIYIWPLVRFDVIQAIINHQSNLDDANDGFLGSNQRRSIKTVLITLWKSLPHYFSGKKIKYLFFTNELSTVSSGPGVYHNRVSEYFFNLVESEALMLEYSKDLSLKRRSHQRLMSRAAFMAEAKLRSFFEKRDNTAISTNVQAILNYVLKEVPNLKQGLVDDLEVKLSRNLDFRGVLKTYHRFLKRKCPEIIFIEDGHYGGRAALLILAAKELGIKVAEPQHGFVNENHPSYTFGDLIQTNPAIGKYYPDYYLTYGPFWSNAVSIPHETVAIGNPHLVECMKLLEGKNRQQKQSIFVAGSGVSISETNQLLSKLASTYQNYSIIYRPHPMERKFVHERYAKPIESGVLIDSNPNLYESLKKADLVISELSTVLFESIALRQNTKLFNSSYTQAYFSDSLKFLDTFDIDDLDDLFVLNLEGLEQAYKYYWLENWDDAFRQFLITFGEK